MENYSVTYRKGCDYIWDPRKRTVGIFGEILNLTECKCIIGPYIIEDVMIRKGPHLKKEQFDMLKGFHHPLMIPLINFYPESTNMGRFVISKIDASFGNWVEHKGKETLFDSSGEMNEFFRNLVIDLCDLVHSLHCMKMRMSVPIVPEDLYVKMLADKVPKVMILLSQVTYSDKTSELRETWLSVKDLVGWCYSKCKMQMNPIRSRWVNFIGQASFSIDKMRMYPDTWDWRKKGEYLMALKSVNSEKLKRSLSAADISWPEITKELQHIIDVAANQVKDRERHHYNIKMPLDYVIALANSYKHFKKLGLQDVFGDQETFVKNIGMWTPSYWDALYEKLGWPVDS